MNKFKCSLRFRQTLIKLDFFRLIVYTCTIAVFCAKRNCISVGIHFKETRSVTNVRVSAKQMVLYVGDMRHSFSND